MRVLKTNFDDNPNIGLYCYANNQYCLLPHTLVEKYSKQISEVLGVPVYGISIAGTSLIGAFVTGNDNCLIVPDLIFKYEKALLDKYGIKYKVIKTKNTALGNNICCNNSGAMISHDFEKQAVDDIHEALGVPIKKAEIAALEIVGSVCVVNNKAGLVHPGITEKELQKAESLLNIRLLQTTIDNNPYVRAGIVLNDLGYLISYGIKTGELALIDQTLNE
ncbi:translation initiation factor IF-6 [Candidatus Woesearchaeota archaeon]|nr:translation initiation factor IF-6 [Candidatus Woesearchaeota archaeon]MBW3016923.1 translation initiation factor IF-6 [Candidatus Woesearchaeota archaeon]